MTGTSCVAIQSIAYGGDGVGRLDDGMAVFVPFAAVGDRLRVTILERRKRFARARIEEVVEPGRGRVTPPCPYYGRCGGCAYQHLSVEEQVRVKAEQLRGLLERVDGLRDIPPVEGALPAPQPYGYRNKITLKPIVQRGRKAGWGYVEFDNATVVPITACPLAHEDLNRTLAAILSGTLEVAEPSGVHRWKDGVPLVLRRSASGEIVAFRDPPERTLTETVLGRPMSVPAGSFSQVNPPVLDRLAAWLRDAYREGSRGALVDAYCGCGVFAVALGDLARSVIGIESDAASVRCAEENARAAGLRDFRFVAGEVERRLAPALEELSRDPEVTLLLDPPRTGCAPEVTDVLRRRQPKTILFVSCDPATLARDLKRLRVGAEYALRRLALFDMFPQTAHFETAAVLARKP